MKNEIINQNGRSMIEMLGVLAIVGVLSVGGIAGYSKAMQKYRVNKTIDQITQIANGVRTLYSNQKSYESLTPQVLIKAKILTGTTDSNAINTYSLSGANPFGGEINVAGSPSGFALGIDGIPQDACIELLTQDWGDDTTLFSFGTEYGSSVKNILEISKPTSCTSSNQYQCAKDGPMPVDTAINDACSNTSNNSLYWKFY